jgi:hypothetical protein
VPLELVFYCRHVADGWATVKESLVHRDFQGASAIVALASPGEYLAVEAVWEQRYRAY